MESIAQLLTAASQSHFSAVSRENMMNSEEEDESIAANLAAQKHFRQVQVFNTSQP